MFSFANKTPNYASRKKMSPNSDYSLSIHTHTHTHLHPPTYPCAYSLHFTLSESHIVIISHQPTPVISSHFSCLSHFIFFSPIFFHMLHFVLFHVYRLLLDFSIETYFPDECLWKTCSATFLSDFFYPSSILFMTTSNIRFADSTYCLSFNVVREQAPDTVNTVAMVAELEVSEGQTVVACLAGHEVCHDLGSDHSPKGACPQLC